MKGSAVSNVVVVSNNTWGQEVGLTTRVGERHVLKCRKDMCVCSTTTKLLQIIICTLQYLASIIGLSCDW